MINSHAVHAKCWNKLKCFAKRLYSVLDTEESRLMPKEHFDYLIGNADDLGFRFGSVGLLPAPLMYFFIYFIYRSIALGMASMASRIGGILSPYIILLQNYVSWLPSTIFVIFG